MSYTYLNVTYTLDTNSGTASATGYVNTPSSITIPGIIVDDNGDSYNVTSIGYGAFAYCSSLTSVTIGENIGSIANRAFYLCNNLTSIICSSGNTVFYNDPNDTGVLYKIENGAASFLFCITTKTSYQILSTIQEINVTSIEAEAFIRCMQLTSVTLGNNITTIGNNAFFYCSSLQSITLGSNVTTIGTNAFYRCTSLTTISLGQNVNSIGETAFAYCTSLTSIVCSSANTVFYNDPNDNGVLYKIENGAAGIFFGVTSKTSYKILSTIHGINVTSVLSKAFYMCTYLTSIIIGENVTSIGDYAFNNCSSLTSVIIPVGVNTIGMYAFTTSNMLASVYFLGAKPSSIGNYAFYDLSSTTTAYYLTNYTNWGDKPEWFTYLDTFTISVLRTDGYSVSEIQSAGVSDSDILYAGYSSSELLSAGYTEAELIAAGYSLTVNSNTCFPANTPILTDNGPVNIDKIDPAVHTIRKKKIVAITKTISSESHLVRIAKNALGQNYPSKTTYISQNHKVFFQGRMIQAKLLVDMVDRVTLRPYRGEILYNVLLEDYEKMQVNNLIVETLHPEHKVAKLYRMLNKAGSFPLFTKKILA